MSSKLPQKSASVTKSATTTRGLGRGLSTLLGDSGIVAAANQVSPSEKREYQQIPVEWINVGPWQPRRQFDREQLDELAGRSAKRYCPTNFVAATPISPAGINLLLGNGAVRRKWRKFIKYHL